LNIRKNIDYSPMFDAMRVAMSVEMSQMKLYCELGRLICQRTEKGAAVAAAEYLQRNYPDVPGFSPRNLRRMRNFYRMYERNPELLNLAMEIGWTQNVVILEADLNAEEQRWYLCAVREFGWSKSELCRKIESHSHLNVHLDELNDSCCTEYINEDNEFSSKEIWPEIALSNRFIFHQYRDNWCSSLFFLPTHVVQALYQLLRQTKLPVYRSPPPEVQLVC